jgi:uncharacterized membrane protein
MRKMLERIKGKFKSWAMWLALASFIVFCVKEFVGIDISDTMNRFLNFLLPLLVGFGIINNPNDRGGI